MTEFEYFTLLEVETIIYYRGPNYISQSIVVGTGTDWVS